MNSENRPQSERSGRNALRRDGLTRQLLLCGIVVAGAVALLLVGYRAGLRLSAGSLPVFRSAPGGEGRPETQEAPGREDGAAAERRSAALPAPVQANAVAAELVALGIAPEDLSDNVGPKAVRSTGGVDWFLDSKLQRYIEELLKRSNMLQAGVVVLRPSDGAILAMASYGDGGENVCLKAEYPAASIFKIISAAAALERAGMNPDSRVSYHGRKHTLYRKQLKEKEEAYASQISLSEAFASSINPVFGKLGIYRLGKDLLAEYADRFYFNRPIPFDARVETSIAEVPGEDFGLAEVASGFNKRTLMSPLHAALLAAAAVNDGVMMAPRLIERVKGDSGNVVYASRPEQLAAPITRATAKELRSLMEDTVTSGTCRKSLKPLLRKQRLKNVELGAKTGTINDREDKYKYDWLVAYAIPPRPQEAICICVMGVHGKRLGIRAGNLGGLIIARYLGT